MTQIIGAPCCGSCSYSHKKGNQLECHRIPPTPLMISQGAAGIGIMAAWPPVKAEECCGEFRKSSIIEPGK